MELSAPIRIGVVAGTIGLGLAISTLQTPEVVGYPDSQKTGVAVAPFGQLPPRFLVEDKLKDTKSYWDDEDGAAVERIFRSE